MHLLVAVFMFFDLLCDGLIMHAEGGFQHKKQVRGELYAEYKMLGQQLTVIFIISYSYDCFFKYKYFYF